MKILRTYIIKECIFPFFLALGVLTCVFLLGNLIQLANLVVNKGVSLSTVRDVFLLLIPVLLGYTLPIACLISVLLGFSRISADNEIIAMRANGIHLARLLSPLIIIGIIISLFTLILNDRIIPYAHHKQKILLKSLGSENPTALLEAGVFIHSFNNQILFIHKIEGNKIYDITIYQPQENGPTRTIIAKRGEFTPVPGKDQIKLKLIDGTSDEPNQSDPTSFYKLNFKTYFMVLDLSNKSKNIKKKPKSMSLVELKEEIQNLERLYVDSARFKTEYIRKISFSFSPLVFILLGFPIAVITNKREKSANILLAMLCAAAYYLLALGAEALSIKTALSPALIMWAPNVILLSIAVYLIYKCVS